MIRRNIFLAIIASISVNLLFGQGQSVVQSWDFNSGIPTGWSQVTNATDGGFKGGTASNLSSSYFTITSPGSNLVATNDDDCNCNKSNEYLITNTLNLSSYSSLHVTFKSFFFGGTYSNATEEASFLYSTNGGTTWVHLADVTPGSNWKSQWIDASAACGNSSVKFAFNYKDGGGWLYGLGIDDFVLFTPFSRDMAVESIQLQSTLGLNNAPFSIKGTLKNYGGSTVTSMNLNYSINGGSAITDTLSGLSIASFDDYSFNHAVNWAPTVTGTYQIKVWASNINGSSDLNTSNDTIIKVISVINATADRVVLAEQFTSSTCSPCASFNPGYKLLLDSNDVNTSGTQLVSIKYQMNWPSPGTDPAYNAQGAARRVFYGVNGIPDVIYSGSNEPTSQAIIDSLQSLPALVNLTADWSDSSSIVQCNVTAEILDDVDSNLVLHIALIESQISHNSQTNGETTFYHVFRKFMDGSSGYSMGTLTPGNTYTYSTSTTVSTNANPSQGSYDFWAGTNNLEVIVWLQNPVTKEVVQAAYADEVLPCAGPVVSPVVTTDTSAFLSWEGLDSLFTIEYGVSGFTLGSGITITSTDTSETITNLSPNTTYDFYVKGAACSYPTYVTSTTLCGALPNSSFAISGDSVLCPNESTFLLAPFDSSYTYIWSLNGMVLTGQNSNSLQIQSSGFYSLDVVNSYGCVSSSSKTVSIGVHPLPSDSLTIIGNTEFCDGDSLIISAAPNLVYQWSNGLSSQSIVIQTTSSVTGVVTNSMGCSVQLDTIDVIVNPSPQTSQILGDTTGIIPLTQYTYVVSQVPGNTYQWIVTNGVLVSGQGTNVAVVMWSQNNTGMIQLIESNGLCEDSVQLQIRTNIGLSELDVHSIDIYPNPSNGKVLIKSDNTLNKVSIYNTAGSLISTYQSDENKLELDLRTFSNGLYWLEAQGKRYKLVINH